MSVADQKLADDQALRDAALHIFREDLRLVREDLHARSIGGRIADRLGDASLDLLDETIEYAEDNKGTVAAAMAAVILWFARAPLLHGLADLLGLDNEDEEDEPEQGGGHGRSTED